MHHVLAGWIPEVRADGRGFSWNASMGGYGPGGEANLSPRSTGTYLPPGGVLRASRCTTPRSARPMRDETQIGLYFYKDEPKYILRQASVTDFSIEIPAGEARHKERAYLEFPQDALLYRHPPHCHSRGYSTKLTIRYPDGKEKLLLNQPRYDFGWQREYIFDEPLQVPAGSMLIADYVYDNSERQHRQPGPQAQRRLRRADLGGDAVHLRPLPLEGRDLRQPQGRLPEGPAERASCSARWTTTWTASCRRPSSATPRCSPR